MSIATRERPILFSAPMVRAILAGTKTQTRRVAKPPAKAVFLPEDHWQIDPDEPGTAYLDDGSGRLRIHCPYGEPGDALWVRETFALTMDRSRGWNESAPNGSWPIYAATDGEWEVDRWRPSIHMPRWASRLTLEITDIRVQRLQEISEEDAIAEGATPERPFGTVWRQINTKPGIRWEDNPWVWALTFKRVESYS